MHKWWGRWLNASLVVCLVVVKVKVGLGVRALVLAHPGKAKHKCWSGRSGEPAIRPSHETRLKGSRVGRIRSFWLFGTLPWAIITTINHYHIPTLLYPITSNNIKHLCLFVGYSVKRRGQRTSGQHSHIREIYADDGLRI